MRSSNKFILVAVMLLAFVLAGVAVWMFTQGKKHFSINDWTGNWEIAYFFENEPEILYHGSLQIVFEDSLSAFLEVFPPKSVRPEHPLLGSLFLSADRSRLKGEIVHNSFKIREGYPKDAFELIMDKNFTLSGKGICLEYCAEGTDGVAISWQGKKAE
jgi:hypothetical protein